MVRTMLGKEFRGKCENNRKSDSFEQARKCRNTCYSNKTSSLPNVTITEYISQLNNPQLRTSLTGGEEHKLDGLFIRCFLQNQICECFNRSNPLAATLGRHVNCSTISSSSGKWYSLEYQVFRGPLYTCCREMSLHVPAILISVTKGRHLVSVDE